MFVKLGVFGVYLSILPCIVLLTNGFIQNLLLYLHALGIACVVYFLINYKSLMNQEHAMTDKNEMYGLRHLIFNLDFQPKTLWFNMGLWDNSKDLNFPEACENLVHAVLSNLNIKPNSTILDVGFGCGDSSILLAEQYKAKVTGITNELIQWNIANERVSKLNLKDNISLLHGSADNLKDLISSKDIYDYIISVDSAYHYNTRWSFLESAYVHLKQQGGMIGLYDLTIDPSFKNTASASQKQMIKFICDALSIPLKNLVTPEEYQTHLESIGYKKVQIQQLDRKRIFGGLSAAFKKQYATAVKNGIGISIKNTIVLKVSSYLFGMLAEKPYIVPVLVQGTKE